jgi:glycerol uptake facilitator-like aquaporin
VTQAPLARRLLAEGLGTALLVAAVVGSGIAAQRLSPSDTGLALLENAIATGAVLFVLIAALGPVSGAHFNPVVTVVDASLHGIDRRDVAPYVVVQVVGGCLGAVLANLMFGLAAVSVSTHNRDGSGVLLSEVVATFGLVLVIFVLVRSGRSALVAPAVAAYIVGAYWFTASTSFANPAVTIARTLSDTFAGIAPGSVVPFIVAQAVGGVLAALVVVALWPRPGDSPAVAVDVHAES